MNQTVTCDAVRLEGAQRLTFLPDLFGGDFMTSEASVYAYAQRYCPEYQGGFWQFYRLPEGGGYMAPDVESLTLCNPDNWFEQTVSGEVAGIILTALVLNHRSWHDKRIKALQGTDQQGDFLLVARGVNGGEAVVAELGGHVNHPLAGVVAELDVAGLVKHQRYRRLRHPCRPRNIVHRHFRFSLHPSSPFREFASYPNRTLTRRRSRFSFIEARTL